MEVLPENRRGAAGIVAREWKKYKFSTHDSALCQNEIW